MGYLPVIFIHLIGCQTTSENTERWTPLLGDWEQFDEQLQTIDDPVSRDLLLLQLAVQKPRHSTELCKRVQTSGAEEKCRQVIGRPHLTIPRSK